MMTNLPMVAGRNFSLRIKPAFLSQCISHYLFSGLFLSLITFILVSTPQPASAAQPQSADAALQSQWTMPAKNYAGTRFSEDNQINAINVKQLQVAWTFSTGVLHGHEAGPLVVNNTMYIVTPYPNILYALDLTP